MTFRRELNLRRFQTESFDNSKGITVRCKAGAVWITAGEGFDDIIIESGEEISFISEEKVVLEALKDTSVELSACRAETHTPIILAEN
jgi:hypothetical protein